MLGLTLRNTVHGNPGEQLFLRSHIVVKLQLVTNLPTDSQIKYWAHPYKVTEIPLQNWPLKLKQWANSDGVGLKNRDVHILQEE